MNHYWSHLSQAKMLSKTYAAFSPTVCGGPHNGWYDSDTIENAGILWPYVKLDGVAATYAGRTKSQLRPWMQPGGNLYLYFYTSPMDTLAIEQKLGSQDFDDHKVGLANGIGAGMCDSDIDPYTVPCSDSIAKLGNLAYFFPPQ